MNNFSYLKFVNQQLDMKKELVVNEMMTNRKLNGRYTWTVSLQMIYYWVSANNKLDYKSRVFLVRQLWILNYYVKNPVKN